MDKALTLGKMGRSISEHINRIKKIGLERLNEKLIKWDNDWIQNK